MGLKNKETMKLSIESFGGNKDNYYNFKQNFVEARNRLKTSELYLSQKYPAELINVLDRSLLVLDFVEFEDS